PAAKPPSVAMVPFPGACASLPSKGCWLLEFPLAGSHLCCHTGGAELTKSCFQALQMELGLLGRSCWQILSTA
uniref:Uncharacterized protein n=1 Tax=Catharus ustulatus TaxID=91951 RepID=A0A8C3UTV3_CATUS